MSFKSTDLMIDLLPGAQPGLVLCGQVTANTGREDDEEDDDDLLECGQVTATTGNEPTSARTAMELALLRRQLGETLAVR
jgi:hypothetical protein